MNDIIKKQLKKVTITDLDVPDSVNEFIIPRTIVIKKESLIEGAVYIIELSLSDETIALNNNIIPKYNVYKVEFVKIENNYYRFNGIAFVDNKDVYTENFYYLLGDDDFEIIGKV